MKPRAISMRWEAIIKLAEDIKNAGSLDVIGWHEALAKLTGRHVNNSQDLVGVGIKE